MNRRRESFKYLDLEDLGLDAMKVVSLPEVWEVSIMKGGVLRVPTCYYEAVIGHLSKPDE